MAHKLLIEAKTKSKAKILGLPTKSFLEGGEYGVSFIITNLGSKPFPGGQMILKVEWPTNQAVTFGFSIPQILPGESFVEDEIGTNVLSKGYGLFFWKSASSSDGKPVRLFRNRQSPIPVDKRSSFHAIFGKGPEEIYELWGMLIAAFSLFIIALEKISASLEWVLSATAGLPWPANFLPLSFNTFVLSLLLSSSGVLMDLLTTHVFVGDLGLEFEWNRPLKYILERWGWKVWILCVEIPVVLGIALFDSAFSSLLLFVGLSWLLARVFAACHNLRVITIYRMIGTDEFKRQFNLGMEARRSASASDRLKLKLPYLVGLIISFTVYTILCFASFPLVVRVKSLSTGLLIFFVMMTLAT